MTAAPATSAELAEAVALAEAAIVLAMLAAAELEPKLQVQHLAPICELLRQVGAFARSAELDDAADLAVDSARKLGALIALASKQHRGLRLVRGDG